MSQLSFKEALADRQRGASENERMLLGLLAEELTHELDADPGLIEPRLTELSRQILAEHARHGEAANLVALVNRLWLGWEAAIESGEISVAGQRLQGIVTERRGEIDSPASTGHARSLAPRLGDRRTILTLSRSSAVLNTLGALASGGEGVQAVDDLTVYFGEGRPMNEGVTAARELAIAGVDVHVVTDAVLAGLPITGAQLLAGFDFDPDAAVVVIGSHALAAEVFVNKSGTLSLCLSARVEAIPVFVLAESSKLLPQALVEDPLLPVGDPIDLAAPIAVGPIHRPFEPIPWDLATGVIFEDGVFEPAEVRERIRSLPLSRTLKTLWAAECHAPSSASVLREPSDSPQESSGQPFAETS